MNKLIKTNCPVEKHQFTTSWKEQRCKLENFDSCWIDKTNENEGYFGYIPENATALFIGTFPVPEKHSSGFFYHSDANKFWEILRLITVQKLNTVEEKLSWLKENRIGITDILLKVQRTDKECKSCSDKDLHIIEFNNVYKLLVDNKDIENIYFTSGGPSSLRLSGNNAGGWFSSHYRNSTGLSLKSISSNGATKKVQFSIDNRDLYVHCLLTPAPQDQQLGKYLKDNPQIIQQLNNIPNSESCDDKLRYKMLQWSVYLMRIEKIVPLELIHIIATKNLKSLLMEFNKKSAFG